MISDISDKTLNQDFLQSYKTVLIYFWVPSNLQCKEILMQLNDIAQGANSEVSFFKLDAEKNNIITKTYNVLYVPTVLIFSHGFLVERRIRIRATKLISRKIHVLKSLSAEEAKMREIKGIRTHKLGRNQYYSRWL